MVIEQGSVATQQGPFPGGFQWRRQPETSAHAERQYQAPCHSAWETQRNTFIEIIMGLPGLNKYGYSLMGWYPLKGLRDLELLRRPNSPLHYRTKTPQEVRHRHPAAKLSSGKQSVITIPGTKNQPDHLCAANFIVLSILPD